MILYWLLYFAGFAKQSKDEERGWMNRIQNGDEKALQLLYKRYKGLMYGLILTILKDREESEDCLQEVFTQVWQKADQFDASRGKVYSFLVTMTRNNAIDRTRSRAFKDSQKEDHIINDFTLNPKSGSKNPHENLELSERATAVREALQQLTDKQRKVLYVSYFNGLSQSEIADKYDIPLGTVKYRMRQGMIKLREYLASEQL